MNIENKVYLLFVKYKYIEYLYILILKIVNMKKSYRTKPNQDLAFYTAFISSIQDSDNIDIHFKEMEKLIDEGFNMNARDVSSRYHHIDGMSYLAYSTYFTKQFYFLIRNGADVNYRPNGVDPLSLLCQSEFTTDRYEMLKTLIDKGSDLNYQSSNRSFNTPLIYAAVTLKDLRRDITDDDLCVIKLLLESGANIFLTNSNGQNFISKSLFSDVFNKKYIQDFLIESNPDVKILLDKYHLIGDNISIRSKLGISDEDVSKMATEMYESRVKFQNYKEELMGSNNSSNIHDRRRCRMEVFYLESILDHAESSDEEWLNAEAKLIRDKRFRMFNS